MEVANDDPVPAAAGKEQKAPVSITLSKYVWAEIFGATQFNLRRSKHEKVPLHLERMVQYGVIICLDIFLYTFTFFPVRCVWALGKLIYNLIFPQIGRHHVMKFHRTHGYDLMRAVIMILSCYVLSYMEMSRIYHFIRGQAIIKLYVVTAMVEVSDKLVCSLSQDILDSLYWTTQTQPEKVLGDFCVATLFVLVHAVLSFAHIVTLQVTINSNESFLYLLLIKNNFTELKTSVFKKVEEQNLFQITCADVVERFKLLLFCILVAVQNLSSGHLSTREEASRLFWSFGLILFAEIVVDWIKHAFITKFNLISPRVYDKFSAILCHGLCACRSKDRDHSEVILDHTHAVARRLGMLPMPFACLLVRLVLPLLLKYMKRAGSEANASSSFSWFVLGVLCFLCLCTFKVLLSILLMANACAWVSTLEKNGKGKDKQLGPLALIEKYTINANRTKQHKQ